MSASVTNHFSPLMLQPPSTRLAAVSRRADVGARIRLGDRIGVAPLAAAFRLEEARALRGRAVLEHLCGAPDAGPERVRHAPELLQRDDLLQDGEALAAPFGRHVHGVQPRVEHGLADARVALLRERARFLGLALERDEPLVAEAARALADLEQVGCQAQVHGDLIRWASETARRARRARAHLAA